MSLSDKNDFIFRRIFRFFCSVASIPQKLSRRTKAILIHTWHDLITCKYIYICRLLMLVGRAKKVFICIQKAAEKRKRSEEHRKTFIKYKWSMALCPCHNMPWHAMNLFLQANSKIYNTLYTYAILLLLTFFYSFVFFHVSTFFILAHTCLVCANAKFTVMKSQRADGNSEFHAI